MMPTIEDLYRQTYYGKHVGALVRIADNSSFWTGVKVERWYSMRNWYVSDLSGNKATLGKDETGRYNLAKSISTNYLTVIRDAVDKAADPNGDSPETASEN